MTPNSANPRGRRYVRSGTAIALVTATSLLVGACSISFGGTEESRACKLFTEIAVEVEQADFAATGLRSDLELIRSEADSDDQPQVASAAGDLVSAFKTRDYGSWYAGLGEIEGACGPYGY